MKFHSKKYAIYGTGKCNRIKKAIEAYPQLLERILFVVTDEKRMKR